MRFQGSIASWQDERGFGFIESTQGGDPVFVHIKAFGRRAGRPQVGQRVSFEVEVGPQGKKRAKNVEPLRPSAAAAARARRGASPAQWGGATLFAIPGFAALYVAVDLLWRPSGLVALVYLAASLIAFVVYAVDKSAARRGGQRVPEASLHLLALAGGWPGALLAQQFLRHKSTKAEFRSVFWGTVIINVAGFVLLCSPIGRMTAS
ncbi:MAG TPA: cold shock and DUF1294 domain-containing protein [Burkholderiaceae bacterium]|jgi:uncharacterized membrane protein YsdA (DUF1294 family)/cold shock CspA family protein|nr:cold shock and DUF1294 domain-containing protein [Burkholderiaceae bacterium]